MNTEKTLKNGFTLKETLAGLGILALLFGVLFIWIMQPNAKADSQTLQEAVEVAQSNYDKLQKEAQEAMQGYCESWKLLATAKADLAEAVKLPTSIDKKAVEAVDCKAVTVPSSF